MKLVQGQRLDQHLSSLSTLPERLRLFQRICEPVAFAHARGVLHRDLKPQNIMVGPFGEVLVMDWGLSKLLATTHPMETPDVQPHIFNDSQHGTVMGTPGYMSPEQMKGEVTAIDRRSDVYSLGAVLRFLLYSGPQFEISRPLAAIVNKCLSQEPSKRYPSAQELAADVALYLDGFAVSAYPEGPVAKLWRWTVRNQAWLLLIGAYLVMRVLFILWKAR
jgi:serine/threonine protein kinase